MKKLDFAGLFAFMIILAAWFYLAEENAKPLFPIPVVLCKTPPQELGPPWQTLGNSLTNTSYAMGRLQNNIKADIKLVVVDRNGILLGATIGVTAASAHFSDGYELHGDTSTLWNGITGASVSKFNKNIAPIILEQGDKLWLLVADEYDNLHAFKTNTGGQWGYHQQLTSAGDVKGRISAALLNATGGGNPDLHVVYVSNDGVKYLRVAGATGSGLSQTFKQFKEGVVGSNSNDRLFLALRTANEIVYYKGDTSSDTITWIPPMGPFSRNVEIRWITDLSNIEFLGNDFHLLYSEKLLTPAMLPNPPTTTNNLKHLRLIGPKFDRNEVRTVTVFLDPTDTGLPILPINPVRGDRTSRLKVYRHHLLAAVTEVTGQVRYARWEYANDEKPWIVDLISQKSFAMGRPSLVTINARLILSNSLSNYDYDRPHIGKDVLIAVASNCGSYLTNFSREIFKKELATNHSIYHFNRLTNAYEPGGDLSGPSRPFISEAGIIDWLFPAPFMKDRFANMTDRNCSCFEDELCWLSDTNACQDQRLPIYMKYSGQINVSRGTKNLFHDKYNRYLEEVGHYIVSDIGLSKRNREITVAVAERAEIPLDELREGQIMFQQRLNDDFRTCTGRCPGFVLQNNYDQEFNHNHLMEHPVIYTLAWYVYQGDKLRNLVKKDLTAVDPDDLLSRKYEWVKKNIFHGVEFGDDGAPH